MEELLKVAGTQGIWCLACILLTIYVLKTTKEREDKLNATIDNNQKIIMDLTKNIEVVTGIKQDVEDIKEKLK